MVEAKIPSGYSLVKTWVLGLITGLAIVIAVELALILIVVTPQIGTNTNQDHQINKLVKANAQAIQEQREAALAGCWSSNRLRRQSNLRIPAERIELQTALEAAVVLRRFHVPPVSGVRVTPDEVRSVMERLQPVPLRACRRLYGPPSLHSKRNG